MCERIWKGELKQFWALFSWLGTGIFTW
jgi:hypothetical protein